MGKAISKSKIIIAALLIIIFIGLIVGCVFLSLYFAKEDDISYKMICYYAPQGRKDNFDTLPFAKYTHVIFAFSKINTSTHLPVLTEEDSQTLTALHSYLTQNAPDTKLILSVCGGANGVFCRAARGENAQTAFAEACAQFVLRYGLDGIDIDWEYPGEGEHCEHCIEDFAGVLSAIRCAIGTEKTLSIAGTPYFANIIKYENDKMSEVLDFVNVMTYDFSPENQADLSISKNAMFSWHLAGYKKTQLNMGIPFYARSADPRYEYKSYSQIKDLVKSGTLTEYQKSKSSSAKDGNSVVTYDTPVQVEKKMDYIKKCGYGGAFCWHIYCDSDSELTDIMYDGLF